MEQITSPRLYPQEVKESRHFVGSASIDSAKIEQPGFCLVTDQVIAFVYKIFKRSFSFLKHCPINKNVWTIPYDYVILAEKQHQSPKDIKAITAMPKTQDATQQVSNTLHNFKGIQPSSTLRNIVQGASPLYDRLEWYLLGSRKPLEYPGPWPDERWQGPKPHHKDLKYIKKSGKD